MSLILDAIKKSERERQQQEIPNLNADHNEYHKPARNYTWLWITVFLLLLGTAYFVYQWLSKAPKDEYTETATSVKLASEVKSSPSILKPNPQELPLSTNNQQNQQNEKKLIQPALSANKNSSLPLQQKDNLTRPLKNESPIQQNTISTSPSAINRNRDNKIIAIESLPSSILNSIPDLIYSSHVFTGDGSTSFIVINKKITGEGENISKDITVERINELDVILDVDGRKVRLEKLKSWRRK
ncbi:MAG TPA: hypothetical protein ENJ60_03425 [Aeromonadales bacterium]|nr:hypothetical protein [Aeromonadales bacterium]